jgi:hypothetical protein
MTYDDTTAGAEGTASSTTQSAAGAAETAKEQARDVAGTAAEKAKGLVEEGKSQLGAVAGEAGRQARSLLGQLGTEASSQAQQQQTRLAGGLRSFGSELTSMADGAIGGGLAADVARQVGYRTSTVAEWLDQRDPAMVLEDVKEFARRRPGMFIAVAAGVGLLAGRLTRGIKDAPSAPSTTPVRSSAYPTGATLGSAVSTGTGSGYAGAGGGYAGPGVQPDVGVVPPSSAPYGSGTGLSSSDELAAPLSAPLGDDDLTEPLGDLGAGAPTREPRHEEGWR